MIYDLDAWAELGARMGMMLLATRRSIGISERYVNQIRDVKSRKKDRRSVMMTWLSLLGEFARG